MLPKFQLADMSRWTAGIGIKSRTPLLQGSPSVKPDLTKVVFLGSLHPLTRYCREVRYETASIEWLCDYIELVNNLINEFLRKVAHFEVDGVRVGVGGDIGRLGTQRIPYIRPQETNFPARRRES